MLTGCVSDLKESLNTKRQLIVEQYEILNQLKQEWDSLSAQHQNLSQHYIPNNIEVLFECYFFTVFEINCKFKIFFFRQVYSKLPL